MTPLLKSRDEIYRLVTRRSIDYWGIQYVTINNFDNFDATAPASLGSNIICGDDGGEDTHSLSLRSTVI
jgi:hypothetical protein